MKQLVIILVLFTLTCSGFFVWWTRQLSPASASSQKPRTFLVNPGQSASEIVANLKKERFLKSQLAARIFLKGTGLDQKILPGTYLISPSQDLKSILTVLTLGPKDIWITFPEGWRKEQFAARLQAQLSGPNSAFSTSEFIASTATLEGRLFPDTYLIPANASASEVITLLTETFNRKVGPVDSDTLILASLIERETRSDTERATIAGIFSKRLKADWPLQVDATIQYAQGTSPNWWTPVTNTRYSSVYNTYIHPGLPPSPISNPGLASIMAARQPLETPYWYYIHDSSGKVHFSSTISEHNLNIDKYLRP